MSTSSRDAAARGDLVALIESLGPDQMDPFTLDLAPIGVVQGTPARIGQTVILIKADGDALVFPFPTEADAVAFYDMRIGRIRADIARLTAAREQGPDAMVEAIMSFLADDEDEDTVPILVPVPVSTLD